MNSCDDLIEGLRRYDDAALRRVVEREVSGLYALAFSILGAEQDAEDACQEVLLKLLRAAPGLSSDAALRAWLRRVCVNHCLDQRRRRRPGAMAFSADAAAIESRDPGPQEQVEEAEFRETLRCALSQLPAMQSTVFVLRHFHGCSTREAAALLGCAEGTVKAHLSRAVGRLRVLLSEWRVSGREVNR